MLGAGLSTLPRRAGAEPHCKLCDFSNHAEVPRTHKTGRRHACCSWIKTQDGQPRDLTKVADVRRADALTKFESSHTNEEIRKSKFQSLRLIFAIELAGAESDRHTDRVDGHRSNQLFDEFLAL